MYLHPDLARTLAADRARRLRTRTVARGAGPSSATRGRSRTRHR